MNKIVITIIGVLVVAGGVYAYSNNQKETAMAEPKVVEEKEIAEENDEMMKDDDIMNKGGEVMMKGSYEAYAPEKLARAETGDVVLSFHASWCPSCRALDADIVQNMNAIPSDVSILKVDYDTESELKKKYGVSVQNTLVQVDAEGNLIKKWSGSLKLNNLISEIQ